MLLSGNGETLKQTQKDGKISIFGVTTKSAGYKKRASFSKFDVLSTFEKCGNSESPEISIMC